MAGTHGKERWRPVPGYEQRYFVSDLGRVWSVGSRRLLKPWVNNGYYQVQLRHDPGARYAPLVHDLVLEAFEGPYRFGRDVGMHGPGGKLDNRLVNLRWGTSSEDRLDYLGRLPELWINWTPL